MGLFDSVYAPCPKCGTRNEFQTKADVCPYMTSYTLDDAPTHLLLDIMNEPQWCAGCKSWFALIDPSFPPGPPPRPNLRGVLVRDPVEGEYSVYQHDPDSLRWWDAPFTFDDLAQGIEAEGGDAASGSVHESPVPRSGRRPNPSTMIPIQGERK